MYYFVFIFTTTKPIKGKKNQRITLEVCANATYCHKRSLILIGKSDRPAQHALQTKHALLNMLHESVSGWTFQHVGIGLIRFSILKYAEELVAQFFCLWTLFQKNSLAVWESLQVSKRHINDYF